MKLTNLVVALTASDKNIYRPSIDDPTACVTIIGVSASPSDAHSILHDIELIIGHPFSFPGRVRHLDSRFLWKLRPEGLKPVLWVWEIVFKMITA